MPTQEEYDRWDREARANARVRENRERTRASDAAAMDAINERRIRDGSFEREQEELRNWWLDNHHLYPDR